jgi:caffeoyl-CoA O-methyltransferase
MGTSPDHFGTKCAPQEQRPQRAAWLTPLSRIVSNIQDSSTVLPLYSRPAMKDSPDRILRRPQAEYLERLLPPREALLTEMEHYAAENGQPIADPEVAQLMRLLLRLHRPQRVVEVGTNIGYSVVVIGRELSDDSLLETIELDPRILGVARSFVQQASLRCQVRFHHGAALDVLAPMEPGIDFVFVDCVKTEYVDYLDLLLPRMKSGGLIVADNVLWKGQVAEGPRDESQVASTEALRLFNARLTEDERLLTTILPVGDGVSLSVVR